MTQAYDKDGNKIPFALYKGDYVERDFQTVEQLQATIASQAAQIERLQKDQPSEFASLFYNEVRLKAEIERLRALVKEAQIEGWLAADSYGISDYEYQQIWENSKSLAALQPKEGEE
jgi:predicted RNA-binding protein